MRIWRLSKTQVKIALLAGVVVVAGIVRLAGIGAQSFWHDEALTVVSARVPVGEVIHTVRQSENCPPAYFILVNLWSKTFGLSDPALRWPSALLGVATVFLIYLLGKELFDAEVALTAAALLAVLPFHIAYSQEARPYAALMFLLTLCTWAFVRVLRDGAAKAQAAYVCTAALALYTHTFALFAIGALNLFFLWRLLSKQQTGVSFRRWIILQAAVIVLFGPWIPATREVAKMGLPWMRRPTPLGETMIAFAGHMGALAVMAIVMLIGMYRGWRQRNDLLLLLAALVILPVLPPIVYGVFVPRYGIAALIGLTLLVAYGAAWIGRVMCVAIVLIASLGNLTAPTKADFRAVARYMIEHGSASDVRVNQTQGYTDRVLDYYLGGKGPQRVEELPAKPQARAWLITSGTAAPAGYQILQIQRFSGVNLLLLEPVAAIERSE